MASTQTFSKVPSVFSFQRSMLVSAGAFFNEIDGQEETPVYVVRHRILGTQNVGQSGDSAKGTGNRDPRNPQLTETAYLDAKANALIVKFGLRMIDLDSALFACAEANAELGKLVRKSVVDFVARAKASEGLNEVSRRIARNVANGSFLWRNRVMAKSVSVAVVSDETCLTFDALAVPLSAFSDYSDDERKLAAIIADGLRGNPYASMAITARVDFGVRGVIEVYPSQAYIEGKPAGVARILYKLPHHVLTEPDVTAHQVVMGQAALRDQKMSNRLRTIDTWYNDFSVVGKPLPIEPNGASLDLLGFFREGKTTAVSMFSRLNQIDPNSPEGMFCIGSMIRGGVYVEKASPKKPSAETEASEATSEAA